MEKHLMTVLGLLIIFLPLAQASPSLVISEVYIDPPAPLPGDEFTALFIINNSGTAFSGSIDATLYIRGEEVSKESFSADAPPGQGRSFSFSEKQAFHSAGWNEIKVRIDYVRDSGEGQENVFFFKSSLFQVIESAPRPPIEINQSPSPDPPVETTVVITESSKADFSELLEGTLPVIAILAFVILLAIVAFRFTKASGKENPREELLKRRAAIEENMKIAKLNFYKRRIDEAGLQKIIKEGQDEIFLIDEKLKVLKG
jgi:hypothetical protein